MIPTNRLADMSPNVSNVSSASSDDDHAESRDNKENIHLQQLNSTLTSPNVTFTGTQSNNSEADESLRQKGRITFTYDQLKILEAYFKEYQYPKRLVLEQMSNSLGIPMRNLKTWFQNRRQRAKSTGSLVYAKSEKHDKSDLAISKYVTNEQFHVAKTPTRRSTRNRGIRDVCDVIQKRDSAPNNTEADEIESAAKSESSTDSVYNYEESDGISRDASLISELNVPKTPVRRSMQNQGIADANNVIQKKDSTPNNTEADGIESAAKSESSADSVYNYEENDRISRDASLISENSTEPIDDQSRAKEYPVFLTKAVNVNQGDSRYFIKGRQFAVAFSYPEFQPQPQFSLDADEQVLMNLIFANSIHNG